MLLAGLDHVKLRKIFGPTPPSLQAHRIADDRSGVGLTVREESFVARHPLQAAIASLANHLLDAWHIYRVSEERHAARTEQRRQAGARGGGAPDVVHKTLNRAAVVAAVGAWEAFNEDIALAAQSHESKLKPPNGGWLLISGSRGIVQTPNSDNVRKLYWLLCKYDPMDDWILDVQVSPREAGTGTSSWRVGSHRHQGRSAAKFLDAMVNVRHGFAHQDQTKKGDPIVGMSTESVSGKLLVNSHHSQNSLRCVTQLSILSARGLSNELAISTQFRWVSSLNYWVPLIQNSEAGAVVGNEWINPPEM